MTTFREIYKRENDLIKPDTTFIDSLIKTAREYAEQPIREYTPMKTVKTRSYMKFAGAAAAVCLVAFGALYFFGNGGSFDNARGDMECAEAPGVNADRNWAGVADEAEGDFNAPEWKLDSFCDVGAEDYSEKNIREYSSESEENGFYYSGGDGEASDFSGAVPNDEEYDDSIADTEPATPTITAATATTSEFGYNSRNLNVQNALREIIAELFRQINEIMNEISENG
jgi:hypothetical protein